MFHGYSTKSLKYVLEKKNTDRNQPRYEPFGMIVTKQFAIKNGCSSCEKSVLCKKTYKNDFKKTGRIYGETSEYYTTYSILSGITISIKFRKLTLR